jgi:membrane protein
MKPWSHYQKRLHDFYCYYVLGTLDRLNAYNLFLLCGGLAFSLFTCIIPLVLVLFSMIGLVVGQGAVRDQIIFFIERTIPYPDYAEYIQQQLFSRVDEARTAGQTIGIVGIIGLLFAASGLFSSMRTVLNMIFTGYRPRSFIVAQLENLLMVVLVLVFFLAATIAFPLVSLINQIPIHDNWVEAIYLTPIIELFLSVFSSIVIFGLFYWLYRLVSLADIGRKVAFVSALWAMIFWEVARRLFDWYINHWANFTELYGVYVFLVVVALWVYYSAATFITGAVIGQLYRERRQKRVAVS